MRLLRLLLAPLQVHSFIAVLERSQGVSFGACRAFRIVFFFVVMCHWLGCVFYVFAYRFPNDHYADAPWKPLGVQDQGEAEQATSDKLRATGYVTSRKSQGPGRGGAGCLRRRATRK